MHDDNDVDQLIRRRTQMEVPAEVESRLRGRLTEFRARVEQRPPRHFWALGPVRVMALTAALLAVVAVGLVLIPRQSGSGRVFASAAAQLKSARSLEYTVVLNAEPYVAIDFSFLAPAYRRLNCSWGIEVRGDGTTGKQIVLMHGTRTYLTEGGKQVEPADLAEQLRSLPQEADEVLGERWAGGKKLVGYRLSKAPPNGSIPGLKQLDLWVDSATQEADHVDMTVEEAGKPAHQMHIQNIRVNAEVNRSLFDLTPPVGYMAIGVPGGKPQPAGALSLQAGVGQVGAVVAVVVPMQGSYLQTPAALEKVADYLKAHGVVSAGPPLGRFWSEQHWETGYPVPPGTQVEAPFQLVSVPAGLAASVVVKGPWAKDSDQRWAAFLKSVMEQGYLPAGPAMEIWTGDDGKPATQSTEMRMQVAKAN
jgi:outer membrane lipoprotein-sorting protein/effector-binding domain-containing protein